MSRRAARCTQEEIARALRAMAQLNIRGAVEVKADGTLRIVPQDEPPQMAPKPESGERKRIVL